MRGSLHPHTFVESPGSLSIFVPRRFCTLAPHAARSPYRDPATITRVSVAIHHLIPTAKSCVPKTKERGSCLPPKKSYAIVQSSIDATCCLDALRLVVTRPRTVDRSSKLFLFPHSPICNQLRHLILCQGRFALRRSATSCRRPSTRIGVGQDLQRCPFERARSSSHP